MASFLSNNTLSIFCFIFFLTLFSTINGKFSEQSPITISTTSTSVEKMTHLHFYFHDIPSGKNQTSTTIAGPPKSISRSLFGNTFMADDPLTEGPEPTSKLVGRAEGIYAFASEQDLVLLMVMNFAFVEGMYNGSTLSILGRNAVFHTVREMPIVGGSGVFRFARGYALAKTYEFNQKTGVAVVEYNVYVKHFGMF